MEPVRLVCGGCGVRIKTHDPERVRGRDCPRCRTPLAPAVDLWLGADDALDRSRPAHARPLATALVSILVTIGSLASLAVRGDATDPDNAARATSTRLAPGEPRRSPTTQEHGPAPTTPVAVEGDESGSEELPDLSSPPERPSRALAILDNRRRDPIFVPLSPQPSPTGPPARPSKGGSEGSLEAVPAAPTRTEPVEPRRLLVRDPRGRALVAREYGELKGRPAAILPDGQIGWPESLVVTDDPFVPASMDEMKRDLLQDPEFTAFRLHQTAHYLVLYQCSEPFARASAELLEKLLDGLTGALRKNGLPIAPLEFPLVAVIFKTEDDFRANRRVAPDVQAYYEILSNRIFFYEKSRREEDSPEVSALRKPQTVAHEGTHQVLHNVGIQPRLSDWPIWLVEGLAEYCSSTKFTKKGAEWAGLGQANSIHLATIRDLDDPLPNAPHGDRREALGARDRKTSLVEYLVTRKELTPTDYAFSWALTHYLAVQRLDDFVAYIKRMSRLRPFEDQSPADQLASFREAFGDDLAQMDAKVGKYLKKFKPNDALPHYAVIFEQPIGHVAVRRHYMVSQSPSVIRQWIDSVTAPEGQAPHWRVFPHPTQKKALEAAERWMTGAE